jgi:hypothetical protein
MSHHRGVWFHHDRQAVDGDTLLESRIARTGRPPSLFAPPPEMSITRRSPRYGFLSNSGNAKLIAPEIEVRVR